MSSTVVAIVLGILLLAHDVAVTRGADLPGGDLTTLAATLYVAGVLVAGTVITYVVVPQPTGAGGHPRRSVWSGALGFFAALPIAYIGLVVESQVLKPLILGG